MTTTLQALPLEDVIRNVRTMTLNKLDVLSKGEESPNKVKEQLVLYVSEQITILSDYLQLIPTEQQAPNRINKDHLFNQLNTLVTSTFKEYLTSVAVNNFEVLDASNSPAYELSLSNMDKFEQNARIANTLLSPTSTTGYFTQVVEMDNSITFYRNNDCVVIPTDGERSELVQTNLEKVAFLVLSGHILHSIITGRHTNFFDLEEVHSTMEVFNTIDLFEAVVLINQVKAD